MQRIVVNKEAHERAVFMSSIEKILKARSEAIELLRSTTLSNARVLERNSKSIKDPDPLSSSMANNSLKWPITVNVDRLKNIYNFNKDDVAGWDSRKYRRRQCSFRMVEKWIGTDLQINEKDELAITKMFDLKKERVDTIKSFNWSAVSFKVMSVNLERMSVKTNPMSVEIPREIRDDAIAHVLCGDNVIEYQPIPIEYKEKIKELISEYHFDFASIPNIINFLKSQLDAKIRTLPMLPGMKASFVDVAHVLVKPRYRATNLHEFVGVEKGESVLVSQACMAVLHRYNNAPQYNNVKKDMANIKVLGVPLTTLVSESDDNIFVKSCKALAGMRIKPEIVIKQNLKMSPMPTRLRSATYFHDFSGLTYVVMEGDETISFSHPHSNGSFTHNGMNLYSITMMKTSESIIKHILSNIAAFIKTDITKIRRKSMKQIRRQLEMRHYEKPWDLLHCTQQRWKEAMQEMVDIDYFGEIHAGSLCLVDNIDYIPSPSTTVQVRADKGYNEHGQEILSIPEPEFKFWPDSITTASSHYFKHLHPTTALVRSIEHIIYNSPFYIKSAGESKWIPPHQGLLDFVDAAIRGSVRETCKGMIRHLQNTTGVRDLFLFALLYSFTDDGAEKLVKTTKFVYNVKDTISLMLDTGVVRRDQNTGVDSVYGKSIEASRNKTDLGFVFDGLIKGVSFTNKFNKTSELGPLYSLVDLEKAAAKMKTGKTCRVMVQGTELLARIDNSLPIETYNTVTRATQRKFLMKKETEDLANLLRGIKRQHKEIEADDIEAGPSKKTNFDTTSIYGSLSSGSS
nr:MAG: polymerase PB2 [Arthropod orthomyxo-like virus]